MRSLFHRVPQRAIEAMTWALIAVHAQAQSPGPGPIAAPVATLSEAAMSAATTATAGEVRRIDLPNLKVTLRHDAITHLNMPPMTMVFRVHDKSLLQALKPGDLVRFVAEKRGGEYWLTDLRTDP